MKRLVYVFLILFLVVNILYLYFLLPDILPEKIFTFKVFKVLDGKEGGLKRLNYYPKRGREYVFEYKGEKAYLFLDQVFFISKAREGDDTLIVFKKVPKNPLLSFLLFPCTRKNYFAVFVKHGPIIQDAPLNQGRLFYSCSDFRFYEWYNKKQC